MSDQPTQMSGEGQGATPPDGGVTLPPQPPTTHATTGERPGDRIGPYKLIEVIGEGGFGVVWLAERREPMVQRVALKIIKPGMDSKAVVARFEQERQALAVMDHPNVAKVLDGGVTPTGRPFFVMEHVKGEPITAFADRHRLTIKRRLELFIPVCDAVQHAHMKGIIHRDIKPSNILVAPGGEGRTPIVKVIDFGVAKAVSHTLTEKTIFTERGQIIGTPEYMSPEQAEMGSLDIDTRTDVYSLGVVLYELLCGTLPFDGHTLRAVGYAEIQRIIREVEAPKPSTKLSTADDQTGAAIAKARQADRERIAGELRRELEWIPLKALRKDRTRRYASAESLAADVRRYLDGKPLEAAPESRGYRLWKFVRRNRVQVAATGAVALALVAGFGTALWQAREAERQRDAAEARRAESDRIASYLRTPLQTLSDTAWDSSLLRDAEDRARAITGTKDVEHLSEAELSAINMAAVSISQFEALKAARDAEKERADQLKKVADFQSSMLGQIDTTKAGVDLMADLRARYVAALEKAGVPEAERVERLGIFQRELVRVNATDVAVAMVDRTILRPAIKAMDEQFKNDPKTDASLRQALSDLYENIGLYDAATPLQDAALATRRRVLGDDHPDTLTSINDMGVLLQVVGRTAEAELFVRQSLLGRRKALGEDHPQTLTSSNNLAALLQAQGRLAEAEPIFRECLEKSRRIRGEEHQNTLTAIANLGTILISLGRLDEAEPLYREALEKSRRVLGRNHPDTLTAIDAMGVLLQRQGKLAEAEAQYREALEGRRAGLGEAHPSTITSKSHMSSVLAALGRHAEGESFAREFLESRRRSLGESHPETLQAKSDLEVLLRAQRKLSEAEPLLQEVLRERRRVLGEDHPDTLTSLANMGTLLYAQGKLAEAERFTRQALESSRRVLGDDHPHTVTSLSNLAGQLWSQGKLEDAEGLYREVLEKRQRLLGESHPATLLSTHNMGLILQARGKPAEAETFFRDAVLKRVRALGSEHPDTMLSVLGLSAVLQARGAHREALDLLTPAEVTTRKAFAAGSGRRFADFLTAIGRARVGVGYQAERFALAESNFLEAYSIYLAAKDRGPKHKQTIECVQALIDLYNAWHAAEPGKGYDAKAAEWQAKLDAAKAPPADPPAAGQR